MINWIRGLFAPSGRPLTCKNGTWFGYRDPISGDRPDPPPPPPEAPPPPPGSPVVIRVVHEYKETK